MARTACVQVFCDPGRAPQMPSEGSSKLTWMLRALLWVVCPGSSGALREGQGREAARESERTELKPHLTTTPLPQPGNSG